MTPYLKSGITLTEEAKQDAWEYTFRDILNSTHNTAYGNVVSVDKIPAKVKASKIKHYKDNIKSANFMIDILNETEEE